MTAASPPCFLRPVAAVADRVLLPGDPGRALALAQVVLGDDRRMFNHHRGLWGYTGTAADGALLTIQSTGLGGPSAAIVLEELAAMGVARALRVGTARALGPELGLGALVAVTEAVGADGTSRALGAGGPRALDAALAGALVAAGAHGGSVSSADLFYGPDDGAPADVLARDLQTAALGAVAARRRVRFGAVLAIVEDHAGARLDDDDVAAAGEAAGRLAADVLGRDGA